jgi:L-methionine (R)-S-oxide reductase
VSCAATSCALTNFHVSEAIKILSLQFFYIFVAGRLYKAFFLCLSFAPQLVSMSEDLMIINGTKEEQYKTLLPQIKALLEGEKDLVANLANVAAALKEQFSWLWVGFYLVKENELVLGPFQGPVACTRIKKGRGVCGSAWAKGETIVVPDVEKFPGHIACSSLSRSEIVLPLLKNGEVVGVLDVDSASLDTFDAVDNEYLEKVIELIQL